MIQQLMWSNHSLIIFSTSQDSASCYGLGDGNAIVDSISGGNEFFPIHGIHQLNSNK